jgi:RNA polymerase sigma factor (sigma-70 family)
MPANSTERATRIHDVNQRASELYREWDSKKIGRAEYQDSIATLVAQPLLSFIENALSVKARDGTEDIFQETMFRFLDHDPNIAVVPVLQWLFRVANNYTIDEWRKTRLEDPKEPEVLANLAAQTGLAAPITRTMERQQILRIAVQDAFETLAEEWRAAAYLCLALRFTQSAAAEILELPETTINYYVGLSKARLKENAQLREFSVRMQGKE